MLFRYIQNVIGCVFLLLLTGCVKKQPSSVPSVQMAQDGACAGVIRDYTVTIEGVECAFCARDVEQLAAGIPGVLSTHYCTSDDSYEQGYLSIQYCMDQENLNIGRLDALLIAEGFALDSIQGMFMLNTVLAKGEPHARMPGNLLLPIVYETNTMAMRKIYQDEERPKFVQATIIRDGKTGALSLRMHR